MKAPAPEVHMARRALLIFFLTSTICFAQTAAPAKAKPGSVAGSIIRTDNSQPIKKAKLALEPSYEGSSANLSPEEAVAAYRDRMLETESDETGHFLFSDVQPGKYYLRAEKTGFAAAEAASTNQSFGLPITVAAGEAVKDVEIKFRPAGAITGRVLNEDGEPMAKVVVEAMRYTYSEGARRLEAVGHADTNDLGEYRIFGLLPHKYYVRAGLPPDEYFFSGTQQLKHSGNAPEQAYLPIFYPDAKSAATATAVEVKAADEQHANFNLVPSQGFRVTGKVTGIPPSIGADYESVMAMLVTKDDPEPIGTAVLSANEPRFAIGPVPSGEYLLVAFSAEAKVGNGGLENVDKIRTGHVPVTVASADASNVVLSIEPTRTVHLAGKVRVDHAPPGGVDLRGLYVTLDPADEAIENSLAMFQIASANGSSANYGKTSSNGSFALSLASSGGTVQPRLNASGHGFEDYYTKSILLGGRDVTESGISPANLTPGATLELIVSPSGGRIDGVVLDSNKKPVVGSFVACVPEPKLRSRRELFITDTTNQQGHYVLRGLRPGSYKV
ncbi:MAG: hypothetical protein ACJ71N_09640, partial [Terriglobales bacterium]